MARRALSASSERVFFWALHIEIASTTIMPATISAPNPKTSAVVIEGFSRFLFSAAIVPRPIAAHRPCRCVRRQL